MKRRLEENPLLCTLTGWIVGLPIIYLWAKYFFLHGIIVITALSGVMMITLFAQIIFDEGDFGRSTGLRKIGLIIASVLIAIAAIVIGGIGRVL